MPKQIPEEFSKQVVQLIKEPHHPSSTPRESTHYNAASQDALQTDDHAGASQGSKRDAYRSSTSHDFFLFGDNVFSSYRAKNNVKFLYTGEEYFGEVASAIDEAKETICITGWQINYDVLLKTPVVSSKKKAREKLEQELALAEELIQKLYSLSQDDIQYVMKRLQAIDNIDVRPVVRDLIRFINNNAKGKPFQVEFEEGTQEIIDQIRELTHPLQTQQNVNMAGGYLDIINQVKQEQLACYNDETCNRIEIKKVINEIYKALKLEEKIQELAIEANSGLKDSLWEHLRKAVLRGVKVYIMPWSCPPVGPVQTFDLDTMLAAFQLNAGLEEQRAFFTFSTLDSDFGPLAGLFYSHHQKSVIIDHKIGFVGGMDLAYGRRDDKSFNLDASVRFGNDRYNPCIPPTQQALRSTHVSRMALTLSTLYDISDFSLHYNQALAVADVKTTLDNWWKTPLSWGVAYDVRKELQPVYSLFNDVVNNKKEQILSESVDPILSYYFTNTIDNLISMYEVLWVVNAAVNGYSKYSTYYPFTVNALWIDIPFTDTKFPLAAYPAVDWESVNNLMRALLGGEKYVALNNIARALKKGEPVRMAYYNEAKVEIYQLLTQTKVGQLYAEIMGLDFFKTLPVPSKTEQTNKPKEANISAMSLLWHTFFLFQHRATKLKAPYYFLDKKLQPLMPAGGITLNDASQPRMPWHDITVKISGPSVHDLSRNFISRWNTSQAKIDEESQPIDKELLLGIFYWAKKFITQAMDNDQLKGFDLQNITPDNLTQEIKEKIKQELSQLGDELIDAKANIVWLNPDNLPSPKAIQPDPDGEEAQVQIIRSAPLNMLQADINAMRRRLEKQEEASTQSTDLNSTQMIDLLDNVKNTAHVETAKKCQTDSQDAWIKAIKGSQYFLYIETQFFQSGYGLDDGYRKKDEQGKKLESGPLQALSSVPPELKEYNVDQAVKKLDVELVNWKKLRTLAEQKPREFLTVLSKISTLMAQVAQTRALQEVFAGQDSKETDPKERNTIIEAIAQRIEYAIRDELPYHVYLVIPVHPEGKLNDASVMHTVHLAMQTLVNGENSLIKRIQRSLCIHDLMKGGKTYDEAKAAAEAIQANKAPLFTQYEHWTDYLTLLNLRTWDKFTGRGITEQIYVHSKMLIADDRVAIVGSANANDRSMLGNRDSELGAIIKGTAPIKVELFGDGKEYQVSKVVHEFRKGLWSKLFAVDAKNVQVKPAFSGSELSTILSQPANKATWQAIQQVAKDNMDAYNKVFNFIPQNVSPLQDPKQVNLGPYQIPAENYYPLGCSIWPTWSYKNPNRHDLGGGVKAPLPFEERFWVRNNTDKAEEAVVRYDFPQNIRGFFVALPIKWTQGENNTSSLHHYIVS